MLRLEHKCAPMDVHMPPFADDRSVEEVPGVELHSGLGRAHVEGTATDRIDDTGGMRERRSLPVDYPVVIVAAAETNLLVRCRDPRTDRRRSPEVEWGPRDGRDFASRDEGRIDRCERRRIYLDDVAEDVAVPFAAEIPVGMLREIDDRRLRRRCLV